VDEKRCKIDRAVGPIDVSGLGDGDLMGAEDFSDDVQATCERSVAACAAYSARRLSTGLGTLFGTRAFDSAKRFPSAITSNLIIGQRVN
jgi:hypothetical protein